MTTNTLVFVLCLVSFAVFTSYEVGYSHAANATKVCAVVPGEQVVSSTADTCTYARSFWLATKKRRAI